MLKFSKRFKASFIAIFINPKKDIIEMLEDQDFQKLRIILVRSKSSDFNVNALDDIITFFNIVSKWHDRGLEDIIERIERTNYGQHDCLIKNLQALNACFIRYGRCEYGWNRTKFGERVTKDNVFLGDINGLFTNPISFWEKSPNQAKDIVRQQAYEFIKMNSIGMLNLIKEIEAAI